MWNVNKSKVMIFKMKKKEYGGIRKNGKIESTGYENGYAGKLEKDYLGKSDK